MKKKPIIDIISALFICLWLYAGASKLLDYGSFRVQLGKSPFISGFAPLLVWGVPVFEILIAVTLMFGRTVKIGLYASFFLMSLFTIYIIAMLNFSYYLPCSCGGIIEKLSWTQHLWFNVGWVILALVGIILTGSYSMMRRAELNVS